jgi:hypothetical protein
MRKLGQIAIGENHVPSFQIEGDLLGRRADVDRKCNGSNNEVSHTPFRGWSKSAPGESNQQARSCATGLTGKPDFSLLMGRIWSFDSAMFSVSRAAKAFFGASLFRHSLDAHN